MKYKTYISSFLLVAGLLFAGTGIQQAAAQSSKTQSPQLAVLTVYSYPVNKNAKLVRVGEQMKRAAKAAGLGQEAAWATYTNDFNYMVYDPISSLSELTSNPMAKAVKGTSGENILNKIDLYVNGTAEREVVRVIPKSSYIPDNAGSGLSKYIEVQELWLLPAKSAQMQKFDALVLDFLDFYKSIDYPVSIVAYHAVTGSNHYIVAYGFNDPGAFHVKYSPSALSRKYPEYRKLVKRLTTFLKDFRSRDWTLVPELSYLPDEK
jgi:hypothetical protein